MSDLRQLWQTLEQSGGAVMKIVLDSKGIPRSKAMILVDGQGEVQQILAAIDEVESEWEGRDHAQGGG